MLFTVLPYSKEEILALIYRIPGRPIPLARPRMASGHIYDAQKTEKINSAIFIRHIHDNDPLLTGPLRLTVTFYFKIPQNNKKLIDTYHFGKPDTDNLIKYICDVAQGIIFHNDAQIAQIIATKMYAETERTEFIIEPLENRR